MLTKFRVFSLAVTFFQKCQRLKLSRHLKDQLDRATASIALNASEGYGRQSWPDKRRFYQIALGSVRESVAILTLAGVSDPEILDVADHLAASLYRLCSHKGYQP